MTALCPLRPLCSKHHRSMKTRSSLALSLALLLALAVPARADPLATSAPQAPTAGPALRQLAVFVGERSCETKTPTAPASALPLDAQLIALETGTWEAAKRHDIAAIAAVCLPDCVEIWANGKVVPLQEVLARIPDTEYREYRLDDFKVTFPSESTGLVHYRAWTRTTYKGKENTPRWKRATAVWVKKDGAWKAACYQESPEPLAPADTAAIEQEVLALEHAWAAAYVNADLEALDRLEAEEWICTTAKGEIYRKADDIREVGNGSFKATAFEMSDLTVQVYGDTVVITGRQTEKATYKGKDASAVYRITDVWLRRDGRWQAIASHLSRETATNPTEK